MSTFLVATDFSEHADRALAHACALAKVLGARIELFSSAYIPPYLVAAVATEDPQIDPKAAQASTLACASPPRQWPMNAVAARNNPAESPPCVAS